MPIYEYRCSACGYQNDYLQKLSEPPLTDCPECGKGTFTKQVTAAGFQLKGTGWYATDFKNNGKGKSSGGKEAAKSGDSADSANSANSANSAGSADGGGKPDAPACGAGACPACS
jgi:putative FmdB family regulatory protein